jgi:hypothetical protein
MAETIYTLFSSESTVQYKKDIFSALSMPRDSVFQFRYQAQHVDESVKSDFINTTSVRGKKALIAFRSGALNDNDNIFIVPVRWAEITEVKLVSDVYNVYFKLKGYPSFSQSFRNTCTSFSGLNTYAKNYFESHNTVIALQSVQLDAVDLNDDGKERDSTNWRSIVELLVTIPTYSNYHFLKCSGFYSRIIKAPNGFNQKKYNTIRDDGMTYLTEGKCAYIDIEYYSKIYEPNLRRQIEVFLDGNCIRKAKGIKTYLESRYGSVSLGFQPKISANNTVTEIVVCTTSDPIDVIQTELTFPIIIRKNRTYKLLKALIMCIGAGLIALPGILGSCVPLGWNIASALSGVVVMGVNNYLESKE